MMFYNINLPTLSPDFHFFFFFLFSSNFIVGYHDMEDRDLGGTKNVCMILIANIDKALCPSTITEFLRRHTSVSASVFIFPSLSSEVYTRGALILDSEKEFQVLCDFLSNPHCIITSSTGRYSVCIVLKYDVCAISFKHSLLWFSLFLQNCVK